MTRHLTRPHPGDGTVGSAIRGLGGSRNAGVTVTGSGGTIRWRDEPREMQTQDAAAAGQGGDHVIELADR